MVYKCMTVADLIAVLQPYVKAGRADEVYVGLRLDENDGSGQSGMHGGLSEIADEIDPERDALVNLMGWHDTWDGMELPDEES